MIKNKVTSRKIPAQEEIVCECAEILTVEPGNVNRALPENTVIAFTVKGETQNIPIKVILKGRMAYKIYNTFLINGKSMSGLTEGIEKDVCVSFKSSAKEYRPKEVVVNNCRDIVFNFQYSIVE